MATDCGLPVDKSVSSVYLIIRCFYTGRDVVHDNRKYHEVFFGAKTSIF